MSFIIWSWTLFCRLKTSSGVSGMPTHHRRCRPASIIGRYFVAVTLLCYGVVLTCRPVSQGCRHCWPTSHCKTLGRCQLPVLTVGWHCWLRSTVGKTPVFGWPNWPCPALGLQLTGDYYVDKLSAAGQPTRPTQPFILLGSINEQ